VALPPTTGFLATASTFFCSLHSYTPTSFPRLRLQARPASTSYTADRCQPKLWQTWLERHVLADSLLSGSDRHCILTQGSAATMQRRNDEATQVSIRLADLLPNAQQYGHHACVLLG
jgi:hypothetical protein